MKYLYLYISVSFAVCSCIGTGVNSNEDVLEFDIRDSVHVSLDDLHEVVLDDSVMIGMIKDVQIVDSMLFVHSSEGLHRFDLSGNLMASFSRRGMGPKEYSSLWSYNLLSDVVQLYDMNRKTILEFDFDGNYLRSVNLSALSSDKPFQAFVCLGDGYLGKRIYGGGDEPELAYYDKDFNYLADASLALTLRSGLMLHHPFTLNHKGNVLYCRYFSNDVYEISPYDAALRCRIDFGKNSFKRGDNLKDEYEIIDEINNSSKRYAVNFSKFQEDEQYMSFCYIFNATQRIAIYDIQEELTFSISFVSDEEITEYILRCGKNIYVLTQNPDKETKLYCYCI